MEYKITKKCKACGKCAKKCPKQAISKSGGIYHIDQDLCVQCGACYKRCSHGAIKQILTDEEMANRPPEQLEAFDKKNKKDKKKDKKKKGGLKRFKKWLKGVVK